MRNGRRFRGRVLLPVASGLGFLLALLPGDAAGGGTRLDLDILVGAGHDSNVARTSGSDVTGDAMGLVVVQSACEYQSERIAFDLDLDTGLRGYPSEGESSSIVQSGEGSFRVWAGRMLALGAVLDLKDRREVGDRGGYFHGGAAASLTLPLPWKASATFTAGGRSFLYRPDHRFDHTGEAFGLSLGRRSDGATVTLRYGLQVRRFDGFRVGSPTADEGAPRLDRFHVLSLDVHHLGRLLLRGGAFAFLGESNWTQSARYGVRVSTGVGLPLEVYAALATTIQRTTYEDPDLGATDPSVNYEDEETRSSVVLRLSRPLRGALSAEAKAAVYFGIGGESRFLRSVVFAGLAYDLL